MTFTLPAEKFYRGYKISGWIALILFLCGFASLVDGLLAEMRLGPNRLDTLPGTEIPLSGPIPLKEAHREDFMIEGSAPNNQVEIVLDDFFSSYWFGSNMWRGKLVVGEHPGIGDYFFIISFKGAPEKSAQFYHVAVWQDAQAMREASFSAVTRYSGLSPFFAAGVILPLGIFMGLINFIFGRLWVKGLNQQGFAEVFKVVRAKGSAEIEVAFGLGEEHGLYMGQECVVLQPTGHEIARGEICLLEPKYASIMLPAQSQATSGCIVVPIKSDSQRW